MPPGMVTGERRQDHHRASLVEREDLVKAFS